MILSLHHHSNPKNLLQIRWSSHWSGLLLYGPNLLQIQTLRPHQLDSLRSELSYASLTPAALGLHHWAQTCWQFHQSLSLCSPHLWSIGQQATKSHSICHSPYVLVKLNHRHFHCLNPRFLMEKTTNFRHFNWPHYLHYHSFYLLSHHRFS